jgi:hypothetical protein
VSSVPFRPALSLWRRSNQLLAGVLLLLGFVVLMVGYAGTSGTRDLDEQVVWLNVAAAGLLVGGFGVVSFLAAGRRAVGRRRLTLFGDVPTADERRGAADLLDAGSLVAAPTMTRYHRPGCPFVENKDVAPASQAAHERAGRRPCGICRPEGGGATGSNEVGR